MDDSIYDTVIDYNARTLSGDPTTKSKNPRYNLLPPSRHANKDWGIFQLRIKPDDEIWTFSGFLLRNGTSCRAGVALIRNGNVIDRVITVIG